MMDLEAMIETIEAKNDMEKKKSATLTKMSTNQKEFHKLQKGSSFMSSFHFKSSKINRITTLNDKIEVEEKEIDCAEVLSKIIFLYLQEVAIPFFRQDKLGVYNGAINLYAQKQINNCNKIAEFYEKVIGQNQIDQAENVGNTTVLDEANSSRNNFVGQFNPD